MAKRFLGKVAPRINISHRTKSETKKRKEEEKNDERNETRAQRPQLMSYYMRVHFVRIQIATVQRFHVFH